MLPLVACEACTHSSQRLPRYRSRRDSAMNEPVEASAVTACRAIVLYCIVLKFQFTGVSIRAYPSLDSTTKGFNRLTKAV